MMDGVNGWWMGAGGLVFIALVSLVIVLVSRGTAVGHEHRRAGSAEDVLAERLARGDIDEEEYRKRREALRA